MLQFVEEKLCQWDLKLRTTSVFSNGKENCITVKPNELKSSWYRRPNPEDRTNRKPNDRKNDLTTEKAKNQKTIYAIVPLNIKYLIESPQLYIFGTIYILSISTCKFWSSGFLLIRSSGINIRSHGFSLFGHPVLV